MASFGERIKKLREEKLETQDDIARILNVSRATVSKYESNDREPDIETIKSLARHFGATIDYLFGETEIRNMPESIAENIRLIKGIMSDEEFSKSLTEFTGVHINENEINSYITNKYTPITAVLNVFADYAGVNIEFFYRKNSLEELNKLRKERIKEGKIYLQRSEVERLMRDKNFVNLAHKIKENKLDINVVDNIISSIIELKK